MSFHGRLTFVAALFLMITAVPCAAQGRRQRQGRGNSGGGGITLQRDASSSNRRQDVEGTIWEFKVLENGERDKSKQTKMTGRIRIKQSSLFAVGKVERVAEPDKQAAEDVVENPASPLRGAGSGQRASGGFGRRFAEEGGARESASSTGERIGDMTKNKSNEKTFQFDEDDEYPLSGLVVVQLDTKKSNGVWSGRYDEFANGKKTKRWRFEMRKVEE